MSQAWKPIVVGLDGSSEAAVAARLAWELAAAAGTQCYAVHVIKDQAAEVAPLQLPMDVSPMNRVLAELARGELRQALRARVPDPLLERLEIRAGRAAVVVAKVAAAHGAQLVVLGGKRHSVLGRWLAGSTALDLLRLGGPAALVTGPGARLPRRVLAAVDLSEAARDTLGAAQHLARLCESELLVLHVVEVATLVPGAVMLPRAMLDEELLVRRSEEWLERTLWPLVDYPKAGRRILRGGQAARVVREFATEWEADVVVLGSHGKGWLDRLLLGSMTEQFVGDLPASLLVTPVRAAARSPARLELAETLDR